MQRLAGRLSLIVQHRPRRRPYPSSSFVVLQRLLEDNDTEELGGIDSFDSSDVGFDSIRGAADPGA